MSTTVGIRDLRNRTSEMIELARSEGEVIITSHGDPVAILQPYGDAWREEAQRILDESSEGDTGFLDWLAEDDAASMDDL